MILDSRYICYYANNLMSIKVFVSFDITWWKIGIFNICTDKRKWQKNDLFVTLTSSKMFTFPANIANCFRLVLAPTRGMMMNNVIQYSYLISCHTYLSYNIFCRQNWISIVWLLYQGTFRLLSLILRILKCISFGHLQNRHF